MLWPGHLAAPETRQPRRLLLQNARLVETQPKNKVNTAAGTARINELNNRKPEASLEIKPDAPCCEVFEQIAGRFEWMSYQQQPEVLTMPHFQIGGNKWRINFCPACGREIRAINYPADNLRASAMARGGLAT